MTSLIFADYTLAASGSLYDASFVRTAEFKTPEGVLVTVAAVAESLDSSEQAMTAAAAVAVQTAFDTLQRTPHRNPVDMLREAFESAHFQLSHQAAITGKRTYCSMSMVLIVNHARLYVGNVGLNRVYLTRADRALVPITLDHNIANLRIQNGESAEAAFAASDARRPVRALGARDAALDTGVYLDNHDPQTAARLGERGLRLKSGDSILICTPMMYGLSVAETDSLTEQELADTLAHSHGADAVRGIVELARTRRPDSSISAALMQVVPGGFQTRSLLAAAALLMAGVAVVAIFLLQDRSTPGLGFRARTVTAEPSLTVISATHQQGSIPFVAPTATQAAVITPITPSEIAAAVTMTVTLVPTTARPTADASSTGRSATPETTQAVVDTATQTAVQPAGETMSQTTAAQTTTQIITRTSTRTPTALPAATFAPTVNATALANVSLRGASVVSQDRQVWATLDAAQRIDTYDGTIQQVELSLLGADSPLAQFFLLQGTALQVESVEDSTIHVRMADSGDAFFTSLQRANRLHVQFETNPSLEFIMTGTCMSMHFLQADLVMASCYDGLCSVSFPGSTTTAPTVSAGQQVILQPSTGMASSIIPISANEVRHYASSLPLADSGLETTTACLAAYLPNDPVIMTAVAQATVQATQSRSIPVTRTPTSTSTATPTSTVTPTLTDTPSENTAPLFATNTPDAAKPSPSPEG